MSIRAWRGNLKERHQRLVNTSVNTPEGVSQVYGSSLVNSKDLQFTRPLPSRSGAEEGTRTLTPLSWQRTLSRSGAHPPSGSVHGVESFLADRQLRGLSPSTCRFYEGYLRRFVLAIDKPLLEVSKADISIVLASLSCNAGGKHAYYRVLRAFFRWAC
jgi:hypothetical protein